MTYPEKQNGKLAIYCGDNLFWRKQRPVGFVIWTNGKARGWNSRISKLIIDWTWLHDDATQDWMSVQAVNVVIQHSTDTALYWCFNTDKVIMDFD